jgi:hypothetical protein
VPSGNAMNEWCTVWNERVANNLLYVRYVHLTKTPSIFTQDKPIFSSKRMLLKDYDRKGSVAKKKSLVVNLKGLDAKTN